MASERPDGTRNEVIARYGSVQDFFAPGGESGEPGGIRYLDQIVAYLDEEYARRAAVPADKPRPADYDELDEDPSVWEESARMITGMEQFISAFQPVVRERLVQQVLSGDADHPA